MINLGIKLLIPIISSVTNIWPSQNFDAPIPIVGTKISLVIFFERDIVFNPKEYKSYLYLAKIFKQNDNDEELEKNLNNVLLLNPNNDEAIYLLILLKIKQSDYTKSNELIDKFKKVCNLFCNKENELKSKLDKINADNEQIKN